MQVLEQDMGSRVSAACVRCLFPPRQEWKLSLGRKQEGRRRLAGAAAHQLSTQLTSKLWVGASLGWILPNSDYVRLWPSYILVVFLLSIKKSLCVETVIQLPSSPKADL